MIIHKLNNGGLGNQLFQIAATLSHADYMHVPARFPKWKYNKYFVTGIDDSLDTTYDCKFDGVVHDDHLEPSFNYSAIPKNENLILHGYYQSENYFKYNNKIKQALLPNAWLMGVYTHDPFITTGTRINVAVHIRRGDYLEKKQYHPVIPIDWYMDVMEDCFMRFIYSSKGQVEHIQFRIFSDDIEYVKKINFNEFYAKYGSNISFNIVNDPFTEHNELKDLFRMAQCHHHIIANSSLSWWAAYLHEHFYRNDGVTHMVVYPTPWFGPAAKHDTKDLFPAHWIPVSY